MKSKTLKAIQAILAGILIFYVIRAGGWPLIAKSLRYVLPALAIYWLYKKFRKALMPQPSENWGESGEKRRVIDICPQCGKQLDQSKRHACGR